LFRPPAIGQLTIISDCSPIQDETTGSMPMENQYVVNQHQRFVEPRVKDYGPHRKFLKSIQQQKFLFGSSTSQQPFTKTATFFITSTCTALTVN
jgi:hypothetical protein